MLLKQIVLDKNNMRYSTILENSKRSKTLKGAILKQFLTNNNKFYLFCR